ncbi:hypothetical protein XELAEV_18016061mg [Xenopus laevis]|uniref:Uncharacterized protein n=1 Tax=Xenopus laevis TaxID=8355 RepID=A0A974DKD2_XENLA|nr:hypothetical protein XELAEV_18016061mg [Xenopus laevis]
MTAIAVCYSVEVVRSAYDKAVVMNGPNLLLGKPKHPNKFNISKGASGSPIWFCTTYGKGIHLVQDSIRKYWKNRNIASWVSRSLYTSKPMEDRSSWLRVKGNCRCGRSRCKSCSFFKVSKDFVATQNTGKRYEIKKYNKCTSRGVVYLIIDEPKFDIRRGDLDRKLLMREAYWIYHLRTTDVYGGMNKEWEVSCFF